MDDGRNSWAECRDFFPDDTLIRARGWRIFRRQGNAEAVWEKRGRRVPQQALLDELAAVWDKPPSEALRR